MNGITYYRTASPYSGDFTKNCSLSGLEIDSNFLNLEGRDIKSIVKDGDYIKFVLYNGNVFRVKAGSSLPPLSGDQLVSVTYSELVSYRNNEELIPGMKYHITDYRCTTSKSNTQSANHQFDIIVMAVSENELNEDAKAIAHSGDTYFASCNLSAWELKYCLDNDTSRFDWADTNSGKGVIYYMKDEWGNECPYDFKNIMFARYSFAGVVDNDNQLTNDALSILEYIFTENEYNPYFYSASKNPLEIEGVTFETNPTNRYFYTFSMIDGIDSSLDLSVNDTYHCFNNKIQPCVVFKTQLQKLNNIVFFNKKKLTMLGIECHDNIFGSNCQTLTFSDVTTNNIFKRNTSQCIFGQSFVGNTFNSDCSNSIFASMYYTYSFTENKFNGIVYGNLFIGYYSDGGDSHTGFYNNTFLCSCVSNIFNSVVSTSIFGNGLSSNNFKGKISRSTFGIAFQDNILDGKNIEMSSFGNFTNNCHFYGNVVKSTLNDGVEDLYIDDMDYVNVLSGGYGITQDTQYYPQGMFNSTYNAIIGIDSNQNIKSWNPADLVP